MAHCYIKLLSPGRVYPKISSSLSFFVFWVVCPGIFLVPLQLTEPLKLIRKTTGREYKRSLILSPARPIFFMIVIATGFSLLNASWI